MKLHKAYFRFILLAILLVFITGSVYAEVPVRVSIKFILSATGTRPGTGRLNTDAEIVEEFDQGESILRENLSEFELHNIEVVDVVELTGVSQWYTTTASGANGPTNLANLRTAAQGAPATYGWRTDAINIYINNGPGSAISDFPPNNNIILMNQGCTNTPSCMLHELGHSFNLWHTHEACCGVGDKCADTILDVNGWTKDQLGNNAFGCNYAACTAAQQDSINLVFNNVMSYHTSEPQRRLSTCQKDISSTTLDSDRNWVLTRVPIYVRWNYTGGENGRYPTPYNTLQEAVNAGGLNNKVIVLEQGNYNLATPINADVQVVTRSGTSNIDPGAQDFILPTDLENSENANVRASMRSAQDEDRAARNALKDAKKEAKKALKASDGDAIMAAGRAKQRQHKDNSFGHLQNAEKFAGGKEKIAIQLELAERYRDEGNCEQAILYFNAVADNTVQEHLRTRALNEAKWCQEKIDANAVVIQQDVDLEGDQK